MWGPSLARCEAEVIRRHRWVRQEVVAAALTSVVFLAAGCASKDEPIVVSSVTGNTVCFRRIHNADGEWCLPAGQVAEGNISLVGQSPDWYRSRVGRCVAMRPITDGPFGRVTGDIECPPGLPLDGPGGTRGTTAGSAGTAGSLIVP